MVRKDIIKPQLNFLDFLKFLTQWTTSELDIDILINNIKKYNANESYVVSRILSYAYKYPHIILYFNKYMNDLYDYSKFKYSEIISSLRLLYKYNNLTKKDLYYIKSNENKDNRYQILDIIYKYYKFIYEYKLNISELNFIYELISIGKLTKDQINDMNKIVNGKDSKNIEFKQQSTDNENNLNNNFETYFEEMKNRKLSDEIQTFVDDIKIRKKNREECKNCKLYDRSIVVLDTNVSTFEPVDIVFIALNPGESEKVFDKPLIGKAGKFHRKFMHLMHPDTKWVLTNILLCQTANQKEIGKKDDEIITEALKCYGNLNDILTKFPAKYYALLGVPVMKMFGLKGSIVQSSGKITEINGCKFIPMPHPSAVMQYHGDFEIAYKSSFELIYELLNNDKEKKQIKLSDININKIENKIIEKTDTDTLNSTLFDITVLDGKTILMVFIDDNGNKKYIKKEYKEPIYIRNKDRTDCNMLESEFDYILYVNGYNKQKLISSLNDSIETAKQNLIISKD